MNEFLTAKEVADICKVKTSKAYQIIRVLNGELEKKGFLVITGKINKKYLLERFNLN